MNPSKGKTEALVCAKGQATRSNFKVMRNAVLSFRPGGQVQLRAAALYMFKRDSSARSQMGNMMMGSPVMMKTMMQMMNQKGMMDKKSLDKNMMNMHDGHSMKQQH